MIGVLLLAFVRIYGPDVSTEGYQTVPAPRLEMRQNVASATTAPWVDANGWRFLRGTKKAFYAKLPPGSAALAAAEAHAYGVDAIVEPAADDEVPLRAMLQFLASVKEGPSAVRANIGVVDDGSASLGEALNLMGRRNLAYKVVKEPDSKLDLNVPLGSADFPKAALNNPSDFAARVREKLSDERRIVRIFGTYNVIAHVTGDERHTRVHLLNYGKRPAKDVRVRVLGEFGEVTLAASHDASMQSADRVTANGGTELTIPQIATYVIIDLRRI